MVTRQLGSMMDPLQESPFVQAIRSATSFCVVRNSNQDVYGRIWCVCELMYASFYGLYPHKTHVTGPAYTFSRSETSVIDAQATWEEDRERILRVLQTEFEVEKIDSMVHELKTQDEPIPRR